MGTVLFCQLLLSAVNIGFLLTVIEWMGVLNSVTFVSILGILTISLPTFFYCKLSENVTTDLEAIEDAFRECLWYYLPVKQQQMFILPMLRAQREYRMMGLGMIGCSLPVFSSVNYFCTINFLTIFKLIFLISLFFLADNADLKFVLFIIAQLQINYASFIML